MKRRWHWLPLAALLIGGLALGAQTRAAGGGYVLLRGVADQSSVLAVQNSTYQLQGSVGQPFAGTAAAGPVRLGAESWYATGAVTPPTPPSAGRTLYLPVARR